MAASKHWVEFAESWRDAPLAFWVHVEQDGEPWFNAKRFTPEAPLAVPHKGFAITCVEVEGTVLRFSSREQLAECIRVLSLNPWPTSQRLSALRGTSAGPNGHWLSRLPARLKSPKARPAVVAALKEAARSST